MPSRCVVPGCSSKNSGINKKTCFQVPTDNDLREKWAASIPGINCLKSRQYVCEKHFEDRLIIRECIKYDKSGEVILQVTIKLKNKLIQYCHVFF